MRIFLLFLIYIFGVYGLSSLVAPLIYPVVLEPLGLRPSSSLYRMAMLAALAMLPIFLARLALNDWRSVGFNLPKHAARSAIGRGVLIGAVIMLGLAAMQWLLEMRHFETQAERFAPSQIMRVLLSGLVTGLAVSLIEEGLFRGLMHTGMRRTLSFWPTAILASTLYASMHFIAPAEIGDRAFTPLTALQMTGAGFARLGDSAVFVDSFITLLVVGLFLSMVRERTGGILWAIGIHTGLVMIIKLTRYLTDPTHIHGQVSPWIGAGYDHVTGWLATLWLTLIAAAYWHSRAIKVGRPGQPRMANR